MPQIRFWQPSDVPHLARMTTMSTWNITPADDKPYTSFETVARNAQQNLINVLQSPYGTAVVADEGGHPVGYLLIGIQHNDKTGEPHGYLADIYVEPEFRRMGLSKGLHLVGEEYLRRIGIRKVTNWTHAHNPLGQGASNHQGIKIWGLMMVKHLQPAQMQALATAPALAAAGL